MLLFLLIIIIFFLSQSDHKSVSVTYKFQYKLTVFFRDERKRKRLETDRQRRHDLRGRHQPRLEPRQISSDESDLELEWTNFTENRFHLSLGSNQLGVFKSGDTGQCSGCFCCLAGRSNVSQSGKTYFMKQFLNLKIKKLKNITINTDGTLNEFIPYLGTELILFNQPFIFQIVTRLWHSYLALYLN